MKASSLLFDHLTLGVMYDDDDEEEDGKGDEDDGEVEEKGEKDHHEEEEDEDDDDGGKKVNIPQQSMLFYKYFTVLSSILGSCDGLGERELCDLIYIYIYIYTSSSYFHHIIFIFSSHFHHIFVQFNLIYIIIFPGVGGGIRITLQKHFGTGCN